MALDKSQAPCYGVMVRPLYYRTAGAQLIVGGKHGAALAGGALLCVYYIQMTLYSQVISLSFLL